MDKALNEIEDIEKAAIPAQPKVILSPNSKAEMMKQTIDAICGKGFEVYARRALKIQATNGVTVPFKLNEVQVVLEKILQHIVADGRLVRVIILKARREGISTWATGRFFFKTATNRNTYMTTVAHEDEAASFLFQMVKRYYDGLPELIKPQQELNNKTELYFNAPKGKGLDSAIKVGAAGKKDFGSGQMIHYLHLSEVAKYPPHLTEDLLTSLLQTVPPEKSTEVIFESTAKGRAGEFYRRYVGCRYQYEVYLNAHGEARFRCIINENSNTMNIYSAIFVPWFVFEKYRMNPPKDFVRTEYEQELVELHGIKDHHLTWRRWAIENQCSGDENTFKQEYPSNSIEAFLTSGNAVFNIEKCVALGRESPRPVAKYECLVDSGQWISSDSDICTLRVWAEPKKGAKYIIGADVSEGIGQDSSAADVIDWKTGEQVAQWHGQTDADTFGEVLYWLGIRYNEAMIACERNNHGITVNGELIQREYRNIYVEEITEAAGQKRKRYGWQTSGKTKPLIIGALIETFRDSAENIKCRETFDEMSTYSRGDDGKMGAAPGYFDDRVISMGIAQRVREQDPLTTTYHNPFATTYRALPDTSASAWATFSS